MGTFAAIVSCVGSVSPVLVFDANTYDPDTFEMLGVKVGAGDLTEAAAYQIEVPDYQGVYVTVPGGKPAWHGARWDNDVAYADNGSGVLLDPVPQLVYAPQQRNLLYYARDKGEWWYKTQDGGETSSDNGIDGTSQVIRLTDNSAEYTYIALMKRDVFGSISEYSFVLWIKKEPLVNDLPALRIAFTDAIGSTLAGGSDPRVSLRINTDTGYTSILHGGTTLLAEFSVIDEGNFWKCVATAENTTGLRNAELALYPGHSDVATETFGVDRTGAFSVDACMLVQCDHEAAKKLLPIYTLADSVTRDARAQSYDPANHDDTEGTYLIEAQFGTNGQNILSDFLRVIGTNIRLNDGSNFADVAGDVNTPHRIGLVYGAGTMRLNVDGVWSTVTAYDGTLPDGVLDLFRSSSGVCYAGRIQRYSISNESIVDSWMAA